MMTIENGKQILWRSHKILLGKQIKKMNKKKKNRQRVQSNGINKRKYNSKSIKFSRSGKHKERRGSKKDNKRVNHQTRKILILKLKIRKKIKKDKFLESSLLEMKVMLPSFGERSWKILNYQILRAKLDSH